MKAFVAWLAKHPRLKFNWLLVALGLALLPARNYYYQLDLSTYHPVVRAGDYQISQVSDYPVNVTGVPSPLLSARSALVVDVNSKAIIFNKNPDLKLLPASTTKIMTGLVALENYDLDQVLVASGSSLGQVMELESGEKITVENLLYGLLVASGNDAATVLAQNYPGGEAAFVAAMNGKAKNLGLTDTQFTNPTGLDDYGHYTTVHDLGLLAAYAMQNPTFAKMVATSSITVSDVDHTVSHELETINELLGKIEGLAGVKTGWTELAGECLVTYVKRGDRAIITVVLGSNDRFGESGQLIEWVYGNFNWQAVPAATR